MVLKRGRSGRIQPATEAHSPAAQHQEESRVPAGAMHGAQALPPDDDPSVATWRAFATFCDEMCGEFTPRSEGKQRMQEPIARVEHFCVAQFLQHCPETWAQLAELPFEDAKAARIGRDFFHYLARKPERRRTEAESPRALLRQLHTDLDQFADLAGYAFTPSSNRDLARLDAVADMINRYQSAERTFLFLSALPAALPPAPRAALESSTGFQTILRWGASRFLREFWHRLQQKFRLTRVALKNEAAQNLARELGETEALLHAQLEAAHERIQALEQTLATVRADARQEAVCELARTLQNHPNPALDQIFALHQRLQKDEAAGGAALSADWLRVFITLEGVLEALQMLQIRSFPSNLEQPFELCGAQLGEFSYLEGSPFAGPEDRKTVVCVRPGWRVAQTVITPARVREER